MPGSSILDDTKKVLGLESEYTPFDTDLIMHINSVFSDLHQLGVGPEPGYAIASKDETWDGFLADDLRLNNVKSYVYLRVRMLFDPPSIGYVLTAKEKEIEKAEWRVTVAADEIKNPPKPETATVPDDPFGDIEIVIDGGTG